MQRGVRSLFSLGVALLSAAVLPVSAHAALPWSDCSPTGFQCATLTVPLDRNGAVGGSVRLEMTRKPARDVGAPTTALLALTGGPGQSAQPFAGDFASIFSSHLGDTDLLVMDQRGTGKSGALSCSALRTSGLSDLAAAQRCAAQIGSGRGFYRTSDTVQDIEAVRAAGGYDQLIIYGVSYGTKVAEAYAAAYPTHAKALILDSVVAPNGPDALSRESLSALPRILGDSLCGGGACSTATPDVLRDVRALAKRLAKRRASGIYITATGRRARASIGVDDLLNLIQSGDVNPVLRANLPGAVRAALTGDRTPLIRLIALGAQGGDSARPTNPVHFGDEDLSGALYLATMCEETTFPWTRGAPLNERRNETLTAVRNEPAASWGLFPSSVALSGLPSLCVGWPVASLQLPAAITLPDVRTLLLSGEADMRTPNEVASSVAALLPRARLVQIPYTGHSVLGSEFGTCAQKAVDDFLNNAAVSDCTSTTTENPVAVSIKPPRNLASEPRVSGLPTDAGRALNGAVDTLRDARLQVLGVAFGTGKLPSRVGGLRSGSVRVTGDHTGRLSSYEYVPGLVVSGTMDTQGTSVLKLSGPRVRGTLRIGADLHAVGRVNGKKIDMRPATAARAAYHRPAITFGQAAARWRVP